MTTLRSRRILLSLVGVLVVFGLAAITSGGLFFKGDDPTGDRVELALKRPPFLDEARAAGDSFIGEYLDQEAGIAAWLSATLPINLTNAASAFRVIEDQTSEYIIGSVDIPNYEEHYDAHVYVHTDGYILAYYLRPDPASKIISIKEHSITTTKLEAAIGLVAGAAGVPTTGIQHYDFRNPNAQNILMVYENPADGNDFSIEMPGSYAYYERGFAMHGSGLAFKLNGTNMPFSYNANYAGYGVLSAAQLPPDTTHTIVTSSSDHLVLMILYTEP